MNKWNDGKRTEDNAVSCNILFDGAIIASIPVDGKTDMGNTRDSAVQIMDMLSMVKNIVGDDLMKEYADYLKACNHE